MFTESSIRNLPPGYHWEGWGFGVYVGARTRTFVLQYRGKRVKIGRTPPWNLAQARQAAREQAVRMDQGLPDPVTFQQALAGYLARSLAPSTRAGVEDEVHRYLKDWLPRSLTEIGRAEVAKRHSTLPRYAGNRVMRYFRAIWRHAQKLHNLPDCPTSGITWNKEERRREPIAWGLLPDWWEKQSSDFHKFVLLTGLRSTDAATVRVEDVDWSNCTLHRPNPKGGSSRAFTIPLSAAAAEILRRQVVVGGLFFPPPLARRWGRERGASPHRLRDTYVSAALEAGVGILDLKILINHASKDTTAGYYRASLDHLRECQEKVTAFILEKTKELCHHAV